MAAPEMPGDSVHLVGIGGSGLSAIARVLLEQGYHVSGSDLCTSPSTDQLVALGVSVCVGHQASNLDVMTGHPAAVIVSSAIAPDNPEVIEARRRGIPVYKRAEWLNRMIAQCCRRCVAVAGTHGKTTTTAMAAFIARRAGLAPTFIVGGTLLDLNTNAAAGSGDVFIIEADEYDGMFLGLRPDIAVITVVEWDHPDCYPTPTAMVDAFQQFLSQVAPDGLVVACGDDAGVADLLARSRGAGQLKTGVVTYGLGPENDVQAIDVNASAQGDYNFRVRDARPAKQNTSRNRWGTVALQVPGLHNVRNALAALIVAERLGVAPESAVDALAGFTGVGRRFEPKGEVGDVLVMDDYAHHPTEVRATLAAARVRYPHRPLWVVFQPHTYSRTLALLDDFVDAFADANHVIILDIFAAREVDTGSVNSEQLVAHIKHPDVQYIGRIGDAANHLLARLAPGAVLLTLGAGDGNQVGELVLQRLASRQLTSAPTASSIRAWDEDTLAAELAAHFGDRLRRNEPMAPHVQLRVGGAADLWLAVNTPEELMSAVEIARRHGCPVLLVGNGANLLVSDQGVRGLVVQNRCQGLVFELEGEPRAVAQSGISLATIARHAARHGLSGLEWAVSVPGTLGGAVVNNAGAHGGSMADSLIHAELLTPEGDRIWQPVEWFDYSYRASRLKAQPPGAPAGYIVLQAELRFCRQPRAEIERRMAQFNARRKATQPGGATIGSMFKNPPGDYAGRLIEAAGLKGRQIGAARISDVHANFFINTGGASAADFVALMQHARETVHDRFGIWLYPEIQQIGDWSG
jgi:UDP-N-acetylmuramate--L-alanine ligase/UDP-N-acetylenolpyruvoylglucosamine reductase